MGRWNKGGIGSRARDGLRSLVSIGAGAALTLGLLACSTPPPAEPLTTAQLALIAETFFAPSVRAQMIEAARKAGNGPDKPYFSCIASVSHQEIAMALAPALPESVIDGELRQALRFLDTPAGAYYQWRAKPGAVRARLLAPTPPTPSDPELRRFVDSDVGHTLTSPLRPAAVERAVEAFQAARWTKCVQGRTKPVEVGVPKGVCHPPSISYPAKARRLGQSGAVHVWLLIGEDGTIESTAILRPSGVPVLDETAETAVQRMKCTGYREADGKRVKASAVQPIVFSLR